jgi:predicted transcriptional regulator
MKRVDALRAFINESKIRDLKIGIAAIGETEVLEFNAKTLLQVYEYLNEDICELKDEQQKPKEKLQKPKAERPVANDGKPVKKVTAGSVKRKPIDMGKLIALAKAGWTKEKIAEEMQISVATVYNYLKKVREEGKL